MTNYHTKKRKLAVHLGMVLREAREKAGMFQADVAEHVEMVPEVYGRFERGQALPKLPTFRKLCVFLHIDANKLLGIDGDKPASWLEEPKPEPELPLAKRKLQRAIRQMDDGQIAVMLSTATALLKHTGQRTEAPSE